MPKQTQTYKLGYFVNGELTDQFTEDYRMRTLDAQLLGLYQVLGNGVLSGWTVGPSSTGGFAVDISSGNGVIGFVAVKSPAALTITTLFPNATNYVYASSLPSSYWDTSVAFSSSLVQSNASDSILIATIVTGSVGIVSIDNGVRQNIGLINSIGLLVKSHRHIGGNDNPDPIDLSSQVTGTIGQENLPDLDASVISTGVLSSAVIPKIDHVTGLKNQGELTHAQLDSFVQNLSAVGKTMMGETALTNLLQLTLALKHQWPDVDEYLVNQLAFIPGISPDSFVDFNNTTAEVDTRTSVNGGQHKIYGSTGPGTTTFTKTFDSAAEFQGAEVVGTTPDGDLLRLVVTESTVSLDDFETLGAWQTQIQDLSSQAGTLELDATTKVTGNYSAQLGINTTDTSNISFTMKKVFASQDWTKYDGIVFYINTKVVQHGDLFFYINDATYGVQNSYALVLGRNEPTVNRDTLLNGWREIYVDLTSYKRSAINTVGFFMSTRYGWDATLPFTLNVDSMSLTGGNVFANSGTARFTYGSGFPQDFWRVRWDAVVPTGTSISARVRVSNDPSSFAPSSQVPATWSAYFSSSGFEFPTAGGNLYGYAQIELTLNASSDRTESPYLMRLYLDRRASADENGFTYSDQDAWESGTIFNLDTTSSPGSVKIASLADVNNVFYGSQGSVSQTDANLNQLFSNAGTSIPVGTRQVLAGESPGFGQVSAVKRGENDTIWVADTENDRVLQIDKSGNVVFGLWGSFLTEPFDGYGTEEAGPGSNTDYVSPPAISTATTVPNVLYAMYNPSTMILSVVFGVNLERVDDPGTTFSPTNMFLKAGAKRVYFGKDTQFSLFGIDPVKFTQWATSVNPYIGQFTFQSHVLQAKLSQADSVAIASSIPLYMPSISVADLDEQGLVQIDSASVTFVTPNFAIGNESSAYNEIRIRMNGGTYSYYSSRVVPLVTGDTVTGENTVEAALVDGNGNPIESEGASCSVSFVYDPNGNLANEPRVSISSPRQGQSVQSSPVAVTFDSYNHPILPVGGCVEYSVDGGAWVQYRSTSPILIAGLSGGVHSVSLKLVDGNGNMVASDYSEATVKFSYGASQEASLVLSVGADTIRGFSRADTAANPEAEVSVYVANVTVSNLFCPIDLQVLPDETSAVNPGGGPTVLVAKLRSPSTTYCLAAVPVTTGGVVPPVDPKDIFLSSYLDGHSVVQYDLNGKTLFTNNAPKFADTKANAKVYLGSASKASPSDVLAADPIRQRAIVTRTDLSTGSTNVIWEFASDRLVSDFQQANNQTSTVSVGDSSTDLPSVYVRTGESVVWVNASSMPIRIVSGTTTPTLFAEDPDLTLYGNEFQSQELQPGEQFAYTFENGGDFGWFSYPNVVTGTVGVASAGVSQSDEYLVIEKDPIPSTSSGKVSRIDSWGKIKWTTGAGILYDPKDVRLLAGNSMIISV